MRLSADAKSPHFYVIVLAQLGYADPLALEIWVNDEKTDRAVEADDEEGWIDVVALDEDGAPRYGENGHKLQRIEGSVRFMMPVLRRSP